MNASLDLLLKKRNYDYDAFTKKIIGLFTVKLTEAVQLLMKTDRNINWYRVEVFQPVDGFVVVMGYLELRPGDMLMVDDQEVLITEHNINDFSNVARYTVNSKLLQDGTVEALFRHIAFVRDLALSASENDVIDILRSETYDNVELLDNPAHEAILEKITRPTIFHSFDVSGLSKEQYDSLVLFSSVKGQS